MNAQKLHLGFLLLLYACVGCSDDKASPKPKAPPNCPESLEAGELLPGVGPEHRKLSYWLARGRNLDTLLLDDVATAKLNNELMHPRAGGDRGVMDLAKEANTQDLATRSTRRLKFLRAQISSGKYTGEVTEMPLLHRCKWDNRIRFTTANTTLHWRAKHRGTL